VENRGAYLDTEDHFWLANHRSTSAWVVARRRSPNNLQSVATGIEEKDKRIKEKTVVPVVHAGKVDKLPKWLWTRNLG
jgi:hypothetical protein